MDEKEKYHQAAENADLERDSENPHGREIDNSRERALIWKQDLRILPLCAAIYLLCYLDRSNIGRSQVLQLFTLLVPGQPRYLTKQGNSIALMVFLIAYALFEVPSNYFLKKLRPSKWIAFLMLGWGASTMGLGGAHNYAQVTGIRFLLGVMEAGLFPGLVYYLTFWYRNSERSMRVALILASATLAGAFGGAIAYGVGHMNQAHGLSAWRWLFIIEGAPSCASAFLVWFFLPDYPETASWLSAEEKELAMQRLQNEGSKGAAHAMTWADAKEILTDWRLYAHYIVRLSFIYFGISTPFSSLSLFTPAITSGLGYTSLRAQLMTVPPWAVAYVVTTAAAWSADHFNWYAVYSPRRGKFNSAFSFIGAMGFLASAVLPPDAYLHRYGCLIVATSGAFACIPPLLGWLSSNLRSTAGTGLAIALNVSVGAPGQIVGVWIYKANEAKRGYPTGHWTNAALLLFVCVGCLLLRVYYGWRNKGRGMEDKFAY
ncbi:major facilitator superfamily domain-containing protein [Aspergillus flavus]|uniref:Major facilitator superfamily domain-containing protein n=1 Tax=Aspergillus flavus (strain ATCC 200026 / FGSC A1120 / IAM 13836 / NRRL 3357 / JCM 12722 / SRRC 167) TaxID=332952 RepID=A0A7U2R152_ASPFN|nr:major facilitator superfamily domain-containing protein [Aspergillus flavus]